MSTLHRQVENDQEQVEVNIEADGVDLVEKDDRETRRGEGRLMAALRTSTTILPHYPVLTTYST